MKDSKFTKLHFRRFEFKYQLSEDQIRQVKKHIKKFLKIDPYSFPRNYYFVNSLYFDSPNLRFYHEIEAGIENRLKIRYRYYNNDKKVIFLEIKRKQNIDVYKDRCLISKPSADVVNQVNLLKNKFRLRPIIWVKYKREPFVSSNSQFRLTFDSEILGSKAKPNNPRIPFKEDYLFSNKAIMELKFRGKLPYWMYKILQTFNLERQAISKYRLAVERLLV